MKEIEGHLRKVAEDEGFEIDDKALNLIARVGEGSMRDSISLLDQLVSFSGHKISYDDVIMLLGTADEELLFAFGDALADADPARVLKLIADGLAEGRSTPQVTRDLVAHFRNLLHLEVGAGEALELTADYLGRLKQQARLFSLDRIRDIIRALSRAELDMKWHPHARLVLEVALLELLEDRQPVAVAPALPAGRSGETSHVERPASAIRKTENVLHNATAQRPTFSAADDGNFAKIKEHWNDILECVKKKSIFGYVSLHEGEPLQINDKGKLVIVFRRGYAFHKERLDEARNKQAVEESLREVTGEKVLIECLVAEGKKESGISAKAVAEFFEGRVL